MLLTIEEAQYAGEAFLTCVYGAEIMARWLHLKEKMNFMSERDFCRWLLELGNKYGDREDEVEGSFMEYDLPEPGREYSDGEVDLTVVESKLPKSFACSHCPYKCSQRGILKKHILAVHKVKTHVCGYCNLKVTTGFNLQRHLIRRHGFASKFQCPKCDKNFIYKSELDTHAPSCPESTNLENDETEPGKISLCSESCDEPSQVNPTSEGPAVIPNYEVRPTSTPGNPTSEAAAVNSAMTSAKRSHHKQTKLYSCSECDFTSTMKRNLMAHISAVHHQVKLQVCSYCNFETKTNFMLQRHLVRRHGLASKFQCSKCDKNFTCMSDANSHSKSCSDKSLRSVTINVIRKD